MKLSPEQKAQMIEARAKLNCKRKDGTSVTAPCNVEHCLKSCWMDCKSRCQQATSDVEWFEAHWPEIKLPEAKGGIFSKSCEEYGFAAGYNQALEDVKKLNGMEGR